MHKFEKKVICEASTQVIIQCFAVLRMKPEDGVMQNYLMTKLAVYTEWDLLSYQMEWVFWIIEDHHQVLGKCKDFPAISAVRNLPTKTEDVSSTPGSGG